MSGTGPILVGKVSIRKRNSGTQRWRTCWRGISVGALREREFSEPWTTHRAALDCAIAVLKTWATVELAPGAMLIRYPKGTRTLSLASLPVIETEVPVWLPNPSH